MRSSALLAAMVITWGCARGGAPAGGGGTPAARAIDPWETLHRRIDLFDVARFTHAIEDRAALSRELGLRELAAGAEATDRVLEALLVEADRILATDRLHAHAQAARTLLELDRRPPATRAEVWRRMVEVKAIASTSGPLAGNARLRLAAYCARALADATRAALRRRIFAVSHCLYPLYDADPDPYFARDPSARPPAPDWRELASETRERLLAAGDPWGRLEPARAALDREIAAQGGTVRDLPIEPVGQALPVVQDAPLYDWTPIITSDDQAARERLNAEVRGDGRGQAALLLRVADQQAAAPLLAHARAAHLAGASELQLLVETEQKLTAPPGDYWHVRATGGVARRAGYLPLELAPLGSPARLVDRDPRTTEWNAGLQLHLVIGSVGWQLVAPGGVIFTAATTVDTHAAGTLATKLAQVRDALPDESTLVVVVDGAARYEHVVALVAAAARRAGQPFFRVGITDKAAPRPRAGEALARRIALRARARVDVSPTELAASRPALVACYQDALERAPKLAGTVSLARGGKGGLAPRGKADARLSRCAVNHLGPTAGVAAAEVIFSLAP